MRNISILLLGILGGISAVLIGVGELLFWMISFSSSHIPSSWLDGVLIPPEVGGLLFIVLGMLGIVAALLYSERRRRLAWAILTSGLLGFSIEERSVYWVTLFIAAFSSQD